MVWYIDNENLEEYTFLCSWYIDVERIYKKGKCTKYYYAYHEIFGTAESSDFNKIKQVISKHYVTQLKLF